MDNRMSDIMSNLTQAEIESIYRMQKRLYWEMDFVDRCIDRKLEGVGLCNLPYDTLADEKMILDTAYEMYCKMADCNIAYNDTLDAVVDEVERCIDRLEKGTDL
jgi:hypothetical protein